MAAVSDSSASVSSNGSRGELKRYLHLLSLRNLDESIALIPDVEKAAYLEAKKRAPELVETESDPTCFLRLHEYDYWKAAERMVSYWKERKKAFGDDNFVLPLKNAISPEVVRAFQERLEPPAPA